MNKNQKPLTFTLVEKFWKKKFGSFPSNVQMVSEAFDEYNDQFWREFLIKSEGSFRRLVIKEPRSGAARRFYLEEE